METFLYGMVALIIVVAFAGLCEYIKDFLKKKAREYHRISLKNERHR
jgi:hypothetical protein